MQLKDVKKLVVWAYDKGYEDRDSDTLIGAEENIANEIIEEFRKQTQTVTEEDRTFELDDLYAEAHREWREILNDELKRVEEAIIYCLIQDPDATTKTYYLSDQGVGIPGIVDRLKVILESCGMRADKLTSAFNGAEYLVITWSPPEVVDEGQGERNEN